MDGRLSFDVYADFRDPHFRVDFGVESDAVQVVFGGPSICDEPNNMLNLWFRNPNTVIDLGKELILAGTQFLLKRKESAEDDTDTDTEVYPVPRVKSDCDGSAGPDSAARGGGGDDG